MVSNVSVCIIYSIHKTQPLWEQKSIANILFLVLVAGVDEISFLSISNRKGMSPILSLFRVQFKKKYVCIFSFVHLKHLLMYMLVSLVPCSNHAVNSGLSINRSISTTCHHHNNLIIVISTPSNVWRSSYP